MASGGVDKFFIHNKESPEGGSGYLVFAFSVSFSVVLGFVVCLFFFSISWVEIFKINLG
jgi:hypothetical protein